MNNTPEPYEPSPALGRLMAEVSALARQHTQTDWGAVTLNLPLMVLTYGLLELSTEDKSALARTPMPEAWVCAAAELPTASRRNLARMLRALEQQGFVSISAADEFCAVELARESESDRCRQAAATKDAAQQSPGYEALKRRLDNEQFEPEPASAYARILVGVQDWYSAAAGVASFSAEKALWLGKGLGVAANLMKDLRRSLN